ncbi:MAG: DUF4154 domain-containing protein, partial [Acidobacteriota bacterium]|nr:DUF4154 domain-containing protein [Acidobacteriota bacterium]
SWLISARGWARQYADKILVMIDGRSLFTPLFSGVIWDDVDVPLGDVERIEVVRGPVSVMWGPNAVNGVINIITKKARQTRGARAQVAAGNSLHGMAESRWGDGSADDRLSYRVWGKAEAFNPAFGSPGVYYLARYLVPDPSVSALGGTSGRLGFRVDYEPSDASQWMIAGDIFTIGRDEALGIPAVLPQMTISQAHTGYGGGYLQAKYSHTSASGAETSVQFSYDRTRINYPYLAGDLNNLTFDVQHRVQTGSRNEIYFGGGYQQYWDDTASRMFAAFNPTAAAIRDANAVLRDEFQIVPSRLLISAGIRFDYLSFGDFEFQPSVRLLYTPDARHSLWFAVSRAVRTPDRFDRDVRADYGFQLYAGIPIHEHLNGSTAFHSETESSFEAGYRMQSGQRWSLDTSLFWSRYGALRVLSTGMPVPIVDSGRFYLDVPATVINGASGHSWGGEAWGTVQVRPGWRLMPGYYYVRDQRTLPTPSGFTQYHWDRPPQRPPPPGHSPLPARSRPLLANRPHGPRPQPRPRPPTPRSRLLRRPPRLARHPFLRTQSHRPQHRRPRGPRCPPRRRPTRHPPAPHLPLRMVAALLRERPLTRCLSLALALLLSARALGAAAEDPEDQLKAATVLTFLRYTEWARSADSAALAVGVLGRPSMIHALRGALDGKTVNNRKVHVVPLNRPADCPTCQVLYFALDNRSDLQRLLNGLRPAGLLAIGESDHFLQLGGAVSLLLVDGHMSFEVSQEALDHAGLTVSSTLLRYGQVRGRAQ